ncbi:MAG: DUF1329 domain-containing protein [bacterium]
MGRAGLLMIALFAQCLALFRPCHGSADVAPGDVIDKTSWEKAQGLVPEELLAWVKQGEFVLPVGELHFKPGDCQPPFALEARSTNTGKYALDQDGWIVETGSGQPAEHIIGLPFPEVALDDPRAAEKIVCNKTYMQYVAGNVRAVFSTDYLKRSGYDRSTKGTMLNRVMDGNPQSMTRSNPDRVEKYQIFLATSPYDIAGTAVMTWRYFDPRKQDNTFAYVPAIRRVRRMSPGNRSDSLFGSDFAIDDAGVYDGKVGAMEWKFLRAQEALLPFPAADPLPIVENETGGWRSSENVKEMVCGYQREGWQGAPWAPVNWIWVKQPVYVLEMKAKDPYYTYGIQHLWLHTGTYVAVFKTIYDKSGKHWKTVMLQHACFESGDQKFHLTYAGDQIAIDERADHATAIKGPTPTDIWLYSVELAEDDFSLAGFQKFCK